MSHVVSLCFSRIFALDMLMLRLGFDIMTRVVRGQNFSLLRASMSVSEGVNGHLPLRKASKSQVSSFFSKVAHPKPIYKLATNLLRDRLVMGAIHTRTLYPCKSVDCVSLACARVATLCHSQCVHSAAGAQPRNQRERHLAVKATCVHCHVHVSIARAYRRTIQPMTPFPFAITAGSEGSGECNFAS